MASPSRAWSATRPRPSTEMHLTVSSTGIRTPRTNDARQPTPSTCGLLSLESRSSASPTRWPLASGGPVHGAEDAVGPEQSEPIGRHTTVTLVDMSDGSAHGQDQQSASNQCGRDHRRNAGSHHDSYRDNKHGDHRHGFLSSGHAAHNRVSPIPRHRRLRRRGRISAPAPTVGLAGTWSRVAEHLRRDSAGRVEF